MIKPQIKSLFFSLTGCNSSFHISTLHFNYLLLKSVQFFSSIIANVRREHVFFLIADKEACSPWQKKEASAPPSLLKTEKHCPGGGRPREIFRASHLFSLDRMSQENYEQAGWQVYPCRNPRRFKSFPRIAALTSCACCRRRGRGRVSLRPCTASAPRCAARPWGAWGWTPRCAGSPRVACEGRWSARSRGRRDGSSDAATRGMQKHVKQRVACWITHAVNMSVLFIYIYTHTHINKCMHDRFLIFLICPFIPGSYLSGKQWKTAT